MGARKTRFKTGDVVVCVDEQGASEYIHEGDLFVVDCIIRRRGYDSAGSALGGEYELLYLDGLRVGALYAPERFVKVGTL